MALSALFLTILGQEMGASAPQTPPTFGAPLTVVEPNRLALTPNLDGILAEEEWDPLASDEISHAYFQWEPGRLYVAATVPKGHDLIFSLDQRNDGWLRGSDNIEFRASLVGGVPSLRARALDTSFREGPQWVAVPTVSYGSQIAAEENEFGTVYELSLSDTAGSLFSPSKDRRYGIRYDVLPTSSPDVAAFLPRLLSEVKLVSQRSAGMPTGLATGIQNDFQTVTPGENMRMRVTFQGSNDLRIRTLSLRSEGDMQDKALDLTTPFMQFDNKGRAFYDYDTRISNNANLGYKLMQAAVLAGDGIEGIIQGSYRVAPPIDFIVRSPQYRSNPNPQTISIRYDVRSNSVNRQTGGVELKLPDGWRVVSTPEKDFSISRKGYMSERRFAIELPAGAKGTFPITFVSTGREVPVQQTHYITIL